MSSTQAIFNTLAVKVLQGEITATQANAEFEAQTEEIQTCPKCGGEMYARCEPDHEGGCFFETAEDEEIESAILFILKSGPMLCSRNPLPLLLKKNKTRQDNIQLLKILEEQE